MQSVQTIPTPWPFPRLWRRWHSRRSLDAADHGQVSESHELQRASDDALYAAVDQLPIAVLRVGVGACNRGVILAANDAAGTIFDRRSHDLLGTDINDYLMAPDRLPLASNVDRVEVRIASGEAWRWADAIVSNLDGPQGQEAALVILQDTTERKRAEEHLHHAARHDALTGLINREEIVRRLTQMAVAPGASSTNVAVLFADLDGFKLINDSRGHQMGDEVLVAVARRIRGAVRPDDVVGRIGGDEFVVVCPNLADPRQARAVAERIRTTLAQPVLAGGRVHELGVSIGISSARADRADAMELLRKADLAMYQAKSDRVGIRSYQADFDRALIARERLREDLRSAILGDGLRLLYQPIVNIADGRLSYVEALIRLAEEDGSLVYPSEFLPIAAQAGLMRTLGQRVLEAILQQRAQWLSEGYEIGIGIDLPPFELTSGAFVDAVMATLNAHGAPPEALIFEVGEMGVVEASHAAQVSLRRMRAAGIGLAIDHFGTGHSSLSALRKMGADRVKIDRSFVTSVAQSAEDRAVVAAVISVAHAMGQRIIVEGVETEQQLAILAQLGCDEVQGFLVAAAGPAQSLELGRRDWKVPGWPTSAGATEGQQVGR